MNPCAKFGPGGNSESFYAEGNKSTLQAPAFVSNRRLDLYEYEAGNGIRAGIDTFKAIGEECKRYGIIPSFHTPYTISLSSVDRQKRLNSVEIIKRSAECSDALGAAVMVVHAGSAATIPRETAMQYAAETLTLADAMLRENGFKVRLGIETMGKQGQLGTLEEVIELCKISDRFCPVVDFGHINARYNGCFFGSDDYKKLFDRIATELGAEYAMDLHCHFSKIEYTKAGEKRHLTFADETYGPAYEPLIEAIVSLGIAPTVICESAGTMAEDAAAMKRLYQTLSNS